MNSIGDFLDKSGLPEQFQEAVGDVIKEHGVQAINSTNFRKMIISFTATVVIAYAINNISSLTDDSTTTEEMKDILDNIINQISPGSKGAVLVAEEGEDPDELMDMYRKASANTLPC